MSSINIATSELLFLLEQLVHTAPNATSESALAGILLHTDRGPHGEEPGVVDLLVGTSADGLVIGHTTAPAFGQLSRAVLVSIEDVKAIVASFKPKVPKSKKEQHHVSLSLDGDKITVAEAQDDLKREGLTLAFTEQSVAEYPRNVWQMLSDVRINAQVSDRKGRLIPPSDRTDFNPAGLAPFVKIGGMVGASVELYRAHQSSPVLVQIGTRFRGVLMPRVHDDGTNPAASIPDAPIYPPDLPPPPDRNAVDPDATTRIGILRVGRGLVVGDPFAGDGEVITSFPEIERDPTLLCEAATHVITAQMGSLSLLGRKMHIGNATATRLMEQLEARGIVGPAAGTKARAVHFTELDLPTVLDAIRGPQSDDTEPADSPAPAARYEVREHGPEIGGVAGFGVFDAIDGDFVTFGWEQGQIDEQLARVIAETPVSTSDTES